jgi:glutamate synthase (NADPH/NADH) small chain
MAGQLHKFTHIDRRSYNSAVPLTVGGRIVSEAKASPLIFNPLNQLQGAGAQASRCVNCGSAGCLQGGGSESPGCPFGRDIPDIHREVAAAGIVLEQAFKLLERLAPDQTASIKDALRTQDDPDFSAKLPAMAFAALAEILPGKSAEMKTLFDRHMKAAFEISYKSGPMGDIYGRICPASLCEKSCTTEHSGHGAITIKMNEAAIWDYAWESGWLKPIKPEHERDQTIVVVGSGFAGYAAAERLRENGYQVVMVERNDVPGEPGHGQILGYKTLQHRFNRHYQRLKDSGVAIHTGLDIGTKELTLEDLRSRFNASAIVMATGTPKAKDPRLEGDARDEVVDWNVFTPAQQWADRSGHDIPAKHHAAGKTVAIIGTGDTAVDCARTAILQGAKEVIMISRHDKTKAEDLDASNAMKKEAAAKNIDVRVQTWMSPQEISRDGSSFVLKGANTAPDAKGQSVSLQADMVISAIGNETGDVKKIFGLSDDFKIKKNGTFDVTPVPTDIANKSDLMGVGAGLAGMLGETFVFAAGQCVRGDSLAAICGRDGVDIAAYAHQTLTRA